MNETLLERRVEGMGKGIPSGGKSTSKGSARKCEAQGKAQWQWSRGDWTKEWGQSSGTGLDVQGLECQAWNLWVRISWKVLKERCDSISLCPRGSP